MGRVVPLASAIATFLARGDGVLEAVRKAKTFITMAIQSGLSLGKGYGPPTFRLCPERDGAIPRDSGAKNAVNILKEEKIGGLIPEVSSNLGYALSHAEGIEDVAPFPEDCAIRDSVATFGDPEFGASRHVANIILTVMKSILNTGSAMNIHTQKKVSHG